MASLFIFTLAACNNDEDTTPTPNPAQTANFEVTIENIIPTTTFSASGTTGFLAPGESETITFHAGKGSYLSFATMYVQSNDLFYGFSEQGLRLYTDEGAVTGDVTNEVDLWDSGTEVNEAPGVGENQAPRQSGPDIGAEENGTVQLIENINDGYTYPVDETVIRLRLDHDGETQFTFTIENISADATIPSPLAPGVWAIHGSDVQLFTTGEAAPEGLEEVAEDGNNEIMEAAVWAKTGYFSPFAPGVFAVHEGRIAALFNEGEKDRGEGLEALAEDGDASILGAALAGKNDLVTSGIFNTPTGADTPGPLLPGGTYTFTFDASEGDYLNFATMLVNTNDLFFGPAETGISLFPNGTALSGDITSTLELWDSGTEVNEYPGAGNNQPIRGGGNSGLDENGVVRIEDDSFEYPNITDMIRVTIKAN